MACVRHAPSGAPAPREAGPSAVAPPAPRTEANAAQASADVPDRPDAGRAKGWHCFHWTAHLGPASHRTWIAARECFPSQEECARAPLTPHLGFHRNVAQPARECATLVPQAFCFPQAQTLRCFSSERECQQVHDVVSPAKPLSSTAPSSDCVARD